MRGSTPIERRTGVVLALATVGLMAWGAFWAWQTIRGWEELQDQQQQEVTWTPPPGTWPTSTS